MQAIREILPLGLRPIIEKLGPEETLRLLWPCVVGPRLSAATRPKQLSAGVLTVGVADQAWQGSLEDLHAMIVEAVNRFCPTLSCNSVRFVVDARERLK